MERRSSDCLVKPGVAIAATNVALADVALRGAATAVAAARIDAGVSTIDFARATDDVADTGGMAEWCSEAVVPALEGARRTDGVGLAGAGLGVPSLAAGAGIGGALAGAGGDVEELVAHAGIGRTLVTGGAVDLARRYRIAFAARLTALAAVGAGGIAVAAAADRAEIAFRPTHIFL